MSKTAILYKDVAPGAAQDAQVSTDSALPLSDPSLLPRGVFHAPVISGEWNAWGLNGTYQPAEEQELAFWSEELSDANCAFAAPPVITIVFDQQYSSTGITLSFDEATGDYCTAVNVKWYQGDELRADVDFAPDAPQYFCQENVTSYNKVVITLSKTKLPYRRAKLTGILFGRLRRFDMTEIRKASVTNQMDLLTSQLPVSTLKWTLDSREDVDFLFQLKQPMEIRHNGSLICVYYIESFSRISKGLYDISCHNAFGVLDETPFSGGVYAEKSARELLTEILNGDYVLTCEAEDTTLSGVIQPCTRRKAAQQVLFAWGVCAATDGVDGIRVFVPGDTPKQIGADRTFFGASVETDAVVTQVVVTAHTYTEDENGGVEIGGVSYRDTQTTYTVNNPDVTSSDKQRVVTVSDATLVSPAIGQAVAQRVYDYYARRNTHAARIVWDGERLGDCVTAPNSWGGVNTGSIVSMEISLSNTAVASCKSMGV